MTLNTPEHDPSIEVAKIRQAAELQAILDQYKDERVMVLAGTCTGKTTLLQHLPDALDMDKEVFPLLTEEEAAYVCQTPWTSEIGATMTRLTRERVKIQAGRPVFGTVLLEADRIVHLKISDALLQERTTARGVSFTDAKNMQRQMEAEIAASGLPVVEFPVG